MNYRINPSDAVNIKEVASSGDFKILLENEQLNQQRAIKRVFHKFNEGDILFKPTFKYDVDSDEWDSRLVLFEFFFYSVKVTILFIMITVVRDLSMPTGTMSMAAKNLRYKYWLSFIKFIKGIFKFENLYFFI